MVYKVVFDGVELLLHDMAIGQQQHNRLGATGTFSDKQDNQLLFYNIKGSSFPIAYRQYSIETDGEIELSINTDLPEVNLVMIGNHNHFDGGLGDVLLQSTQFTIRYARGLKMLSHLEKGKYSILTIGITPVSFDKLMLIHPEMLPLYDKVKLKEAYAFVFCPFASANMMESAQNILNCTLSGVSRKYYLDTKINNFLLQALQIITEVVIEPIPFVSGSVNKEKIFKIAELITNNPEREHDTGDLSRHAFVSLSLLTKGFKQQYGMTIRKFVVLRRMEKATILIIKGNMSINSIAEIVGYNDTATFTHVFKRVYGFPPSALRQQ